MTRLGRHLVGQGGRVAFLSVIATLGAAGPVIGLLLVQDAIDNGMKKGDVSRLTRDVIIFLSVNAAAWVLTSTLIRGLARVGQTVVLALREHLFEHLTRCRCATSPSSARAGSSRDSHRTSTRSRTSSRRDCRRSSPTR